MAKATLDITGESVGYPQNRFESVKQFNDFIYDKGYPVYLESALQCPCKNAQSFQPLPDCTNCSGTGWVFVNKVETRIIMVGMGYNVKYNQWTESNRGMVSITSREVDKLGYMDRITIRNGKTWFSEILKIRKSSDKTQFSFTIYEPTGVDFIYLFESSLKPLKFLIYGKDYIVIGNKVILSPDYRNSDNLSVSIRYSHLPSYHVIDINRDFMRQRTLEDCKFPPLDEEQDMLYFPLHGVGRRTHYVLDPVNYDGSTTQNNTNYDYVKDGLKVQTLDKTQFDAN